MIAVATNYSIRLKLIFFVKNKTKYLNNSLKSCLDFFISRNLGGTAGFIFLKSLVPMYCNFCNTLR